MASKVSVLTLNVQGLRSLDHRQTLMSWLNCFCPLIVCIQETHSISEAEFQNWFASTNRCINNKFNYKCMSSPGTIRSSGVAILFHPDLEVVGRWRDEAGRLVVAEFRRGNLNFQVACLYGPNIKDDGGIFFESFYQAINPDTPVFLCGDFNTVVDPFADRFGCNPTSPWAYNWSTSLRDLMSAYELSDVWRAKHPNAREFTWHRPNGAQASRLDMIWLPSRYLGLVSEVGIFPFFRSDHSYVYLEIDLPCEVVLGKGLWKFNTSHLQDDAFCAEIVEFWTDWRLERGSFHSLSSWWDAGKIRLRLLMRRLSRAKAREQRRSIRSLQNSLTVIQARLNRGEQLPGLLEQVKAELASELLTEAKGAQLRANIQWAEEGESSTAYFLRQETVRGQRRQVSGVKRPDGSIATSTHDMLGVWRDYYFGLFSSQQLDEGEQSFFLNSLERSLSPVEAELCEGDLTEDECFSALKQMSSNKSPGVDGFPAEFYVRFWRLLGPDLVNVFNSCYRDGRLSFSQRSGSIVLLYKKGDILDTANWRPITLLCADYKIVAKVLSNRLLSVIASVVSPDQSCGIPGRFIGENVRLLHDVVTYANSQAVPAAILSLDQEKAFDRVEWAYMSKVLVKLGFGPSFCKWVGLLYTDVFSAVIVNGFLSELFPVHRGVRQGCPLSPLLYVLVAESLACAIRAEQAIVGFPLPGGRTRVKLSQYADDTSTFVMSDNSILALMALFGRYELASGAKLNPRKCHGLLLGPWRSRTSFPVAFQWSSREICVLGSRLSNTDTEDWGSKIKKLLNILASWRTRALSRRGRALILNSLGLSTLWYLGSVVHVPPDIVNRLNKVVFPFIWNGKRDAVRRATVILPTGRGGLGVVDIAAKLQSLLVMWVKRFFFGVDRGWQSFFRFYLRRAFLAEPVSRAFKLSSVGPSTLKMLPPFYRDVFSAWLAVSGGFVSDQWIIRRPGAADLPLSEASSNVIYRLLIRARCEQPRCCQKYAALSVEWSVVWSNLSWLRFVRPALDTSWSLAHGALPTADRLIRFGMAVSPRCHCGSDETIEHLFVVCPFAVALVDWFYPLLRAFRATASRPSTREVRFAFASSDHLPGGFTALMGLLRHRVWLCRNAFRFDGVRPDLAAAVARISSSWRFLVTVARRSVPHRRFVEQWLAGGVLGVVQPDGSLSFPPSLST